MKRFLVGSQLVPPDPPPVHTHTPGCYLAEGDHVRGRGRPLPTLEAAVLLLQRLLLPFLCLEPMGAGPLSPGRGTNRKKVPPPPSRNRRTRLPSPSDGPRVSTDRGNDRCSGVWTGGSAVREQATTTTTTQCRGHWRRPLATGTRATPGDGREWEREGGSEGAHRDVGHGVGEALAEGEHLVLLEVHERPVLHLRLLHRGVGLTGGPPPPRPPPTPYISKLTHTTSPAGEGTGGAFLPVWRHSRKKGRSRSGIPPSTGQCVDGDGH